MVQAADFSINNSTKTSSFHRTSFYKVAKGRVVGPQKLFLLHSSAFHASSESFKARKLQKSPILLRSVRKLFLSRMCMSDYSLNQNKKIRKERAVLNQSHPNKGFEKSMVPCNGETKEVIDVITAPEGHKLRQNGRGPRASSQGKLWLLY